MGEAFAWGFLAASSLLLALSCSIGRSTLELITAFGSGVLISAVAYELVEDAFTEAGGNGRWRSACSQGPSPSSSATSSSAASAERGEGASGVQDKGSGLAILLGALLDGIPESIVLGLTVLQAGVSSAMLAAVLISNLPKALSSTPPGDC